VTRRRRAGTIATIALASNLLLAACVGTAAPGKGALTVFAAASLQPAFTQMARHVDLDVTFNFAGTQTLATQIDQGAQADVFASADTAHMTAVQSAGLLDGSPQLFAHNRLEIAVARGNPKGIHSLADLARPGLVVVLADPSVPAGKYAQQALAKAGVKVKPASLELEVTAVLNKVVLGEADAGIVYSSDVATSGHVDGIPIPDGQNVVADYPIAILKDAPDRASAQAFVRFVLSAEGQSLLTAAGFARA
jgi:molybdate transport system substrate-binding protein